MISFRGNRSLMGPLAVIAVMSAASLGGVGEASADAEESISCEAFASPLVELERQNMQRRCPIVNAEWNASAQNPGGEVDWDKVQQDYVNFCANSGIAPSARAWYRDHYVEGKRKVLADNPDCPPQQTSPNPAAPGQPSSNPPVPGSDPAHVPAPPGSSSTPGPGSSAPGAAGQNGWAVYCPGSQIWGKYIVYSNTEGTCRGQLGWYMWIFSTLDPQKLYVMCPDRMEYDNEGREYIVAYWELYYTGIDFRNEHGEYPKDPTQWIPQWAGEMKLYDPGTCPVPGNLMKTTWQNFGAPGVSNWQAYNGPSYEIAFLPPGTEPVAPGNDPGSGGGTPSARRCGDIDGDWRLSAEGRPGAGAIASMRIEVRGAEIAASGDGWNGRGSFDGTRGYYDWQFADGRRGRTTIALDGDCVLHGQVRGSGLDWDYQAQRR